MEAENLNEAVNPALSKGDVSSSKKFAYTEAHSIALRVLELLRPHCIRCEIAGSIRREKSEVKDIEIVAIPKPYQTGLFQDGIAEIVNQWQKVKGELEYGKTKYTQRILPEGIKLDLFFAEEGNWGVDFCHTNRECRLQP